jgi:ABC-type antimicrobial peptide transport system permease subunit
MLAPTNTPGVDESGFYVPFYAAPFGPVSADPSVMRFATVVVKPHPGQRVDSLANALRREVAKADPNLPLYFVGTTESQIEVFAAQVRVIATMFTMFGIAAIVLASVGVYGVMSFAVNQRTQEFGVRMALGANDHRILAMVLKQGIVQIAIGLALGMGLALSIAIVAGAGIQSTLFGVSARDPLTYASVFAIVAIVSLVATMVPARRATRVDPMIALRAE